MVDTHAHLSVCDQPEAELVAAAREAGVRRILTVGLDEETNAAAVAAAEAHGEVFACVGRHPNSAAGFDAKAAEQIERLSGNPRVRAIGETGFDYYRDRASPAEQRAAFERQIGIARGAGLPLVIHMRDSVEDTFALLRERADGVTVVLHCFSAPGRVAEAAAMGWYCSFGGNLTYPKSEDLREAAAEVPDELLLIETDSPFLAPQPLRGKPNEPAHVVETAKRLAELRRIDLGELERLVEANAARVFGW